MRPPRHLQWWLLCTGPCLALALTCSVLVDRTALAAVATVGALVGVLASRVRHDRARHPGLLPEPTGTFRHAVVGAAVMVGALSLVVQLGPVGLLLVLAVGLTSPYVTGLVHRGLRPTSVRHLSDLDLCRAWAESSYLLGHRRQVHVLELVVRRGRYLDELRRRHEDAFASWVGLAGGADDALAFYFLPADRGTGGSCAVRSRGSGPDGGSGRARG